MIYNVYFIETDLLNIKIYCLYGISVCQNIAEYLNSSLSFVVAH